MQQSQYYERCENCFQWNESIKRAVKEYGHCNQEPSQKVYYATKDIVVANESNPRVCFCKECWQGILDTEGDP